MMRKVDESLVQNRFRRNCYEIYKRSAKAKMSFPSPVIIYYLEVPAMILFQTSVLVVTTACNVYYN